MTPTIYISAPVTVDWAEVLKVNTRLLASGFNIRTSYWVRHLIYSKNFVLDCDIFVFMHPKNAWNFNVNTLPSGVFRELNQAMTLGKQIFMAYRNQEGKYNLYSITHNNAEVRGIAGSTTDIWDTIEAIASSTPKTVTTSQGSNTASNRNVVINLDKDSNVFDKVALQARIDYLSSLREYPAIPSECTDYDPRLLL